MLDLHCICFRMKVYAGTAMHDFGKCITYLTIYPPPMLNFDNKTVCIG